MSVVTRIRAWPRNAATGLVVAIWLAGGNDGTPHHDGVGHYQAGLIADPRFEASVSFSNDGWAARAVPTASAIAWAPAEPARLDPMAGLYWPDAAIEIDRVKNGVVTRRLTGTIAEATIAEGKLVITCADLAKKLDNPLTTATFSGGGGIEGGDFAIGRAKRRSFGLVWNVEGRLLDQANNIYEFGDPAFPLQGCTALRDMGRAGPLGIVAWQGSVGATFNALKAAVPERGGGVFAPSIACAKWWTQPAGPLTADLKGQASGYSETPSGVAMQILTAVGGPVISDMGPARSGAVGVHVGDNNETAAAILDRLLQRISLGWRLNAVGSVEIWEYGFSGPVEALNAIFIGRESTIHPVKSRQIGYKKNERIHGDGEISAAVQASDVVYEDGSTAEDYKPAEPGATNGATPEEKDQLAQLEADTAVAQTRMAQAEADIADLFETYGDSASAAQSALAAAQSAQTAQDAKANAEQAKADAQAAYSAAAAAQSAAEDFADAADLSAAASDTARAAAVTAKSAAETARAQAQAAKTDAEAAFSGSATARDAAVAAKTAAETARTQAQTAKTDAETAFFNSATARDAAQAARTASELARDNAQTYAANANGSATAAAGSATLASTRATEAGNSATAAAASSVSAQSAYTDALRTVYVSSPLLPSTFGEGAKHWTNLRFGNPVTVPAATGAPMADPDLGASLEISDWTNAGNNILSKGALPVLPGRIYEVSAKFKITASDGSVSLNVILGAMLDNYGTAAASYVGGPATTCDGTGTFTLVRKFALGGGANTTTIPADVVLARPGLRLSSATEAGLVLRVSEIRIMDVTEREQATDQANAAAASASSAATSAGAAGTSATAAQTSATTATTKAGEASTSASQASTSATNAAGSASAAQTSAGAAATSASNAGQSATAASNSAQTASTKATEAGQSAASAATSETTATTKAGEASTSASQASTSATNAAGSASSASTSAGAAAGSATAAGNSATAASGSANTASTKATEAGNSATAAATSAVSASSAYSSAVGVVIPTLPEKYTNANDPYFSTEHVGAPASIPPAFANATSPEGTPVYQIILTANGGANWAQRGVFPAVTGRVYEVEFEYRIPAVSGSVDVKAYVRSLDGSYASITSSAVSMPAIAGRRTQTFLVSAAGADINWHSTAVWLRAFINITTGSDGSITIQPLRIRVSDVTAREAAKSSASAAATSASAAATSATSAGQSASAAQTSATTAATQAGNASTSAGQASTSATNAAGSASAAQTSAGAAATSATNAGNSATAASTSAQTASTKATEAAQSASSAQTSATTAATKASEASTSATQASTSATNAAGSASSASTSAGAAAGSATAAGNSATAASGSANTAATKATEAGNSATAAASSAVSASSALENSGYLDAGFVSDFNNTLNSWASSSSANLTTSAAGMQVAVTGVDPYIYRSGLSFDGARFTRVVVSLTRTANRSSGTWDGSLYWSRAGHSWASEYKADTAMVGGDPSLNQRTQLVYDMPTAFGGADWTAGTITGIRLDLDQGNGGSFVIHSIRVVGPDALAPAKAAQAAATSASSAATSATNAGQSATSATASANTASTKAGEATSSAGSAASSAGDALGYRNSAQTAATNAATSATSAGNSATAASGSASSAATSATNAGNSATSANSSAVAAASTYSSLQETVANQSQALPYDFKEGNAYWTNDRTGSPIGRPLAAGSLISNDAIFGTSWEISNWTSAGNNILTRGVVPIQAGRFYEVRVRFRMMSGAPAEFNVVAAGMIADYSGTDLAFRGGTVINANDASVKEVVGLFSDTTANGATAFSSEAVFARFGLRLNQSKAVVLRIASIRVTDVTEKLAAANSATAASGSASNAATSATAAGTSATAAQGSATTASTQAANAANSASAAATSASAASSSSTGAAQSASAAESSRIAADIASSNAGYIDAGLVADFTDGTLNGFAANNATLTGGSGGLRVVPTSGDPYISRTGLSIQGSRFTRVLIELTRTAPTLGAWDGTLYWATSGHGWNGSYRALAVQGEPAINATTTLVFDMPNAVSGASDWTSSTITGLRFDTDNAVAVGREVTIRSIRVVGSDALAPAKAAQAAAISASSAAGSATAAGNSASAAQGSATNAATSAGQASTSAGQASTSASQASTSATNAAGSASMASTAATNAAQSATNAGNSATAAAGSASIASTKATEAGNSATAAAGSAVSAASSYNAMIQSQAASSVLPYDFSDGLNQWTNSRSGLPQNVGNATGTVIVGDGIFGQCADFAWFKAGQGVLTRGVVQTTAGRFYEVRARIRVRQGDGSYQFTIIGEWMDGSCVEISNSFVSNTTVDSGVREVVALFSDTTANGATAWPSTAILARFGLRLSSAETDMVVRIGSIRVTDVTDKMAAANSASAASTSASNAATSAGQAGASATAASGHANTAQTKAGEAASSASAASSSAASASSSASSASSSAGNASIYAGQAQSAATTASSQATVATNAAAAAQSIATISAQVAAASINPNPVFSDWPNGQALPTNYSLWAGTYITTYKMTGAQSPYAPMTSMASNSENGGGGMQATTYTATQVIQNNMWLVLEVDARRNSGDLRGSCALFRVVNPTGSTAQNHYIDLYNEADTAGVSGNGNTGVRRWRKLIQVTTSSAHGYTIFLMNRYSGAPSYITAATANQIEWHKASFRPATDQEIAAKQATADISTLSATVAQQASTLSTLSTQYASLSSTVSAQGATVSQQASAIASVENNVTTLFARWGFEIDVNGYVSGMVMNNNGQRADLTFRTDRARFITPSGKGGFWNLDFDSQGRPTQTIGDDASGVTIELGYLA